MVIEGLFIQHTGVVGNKGELKLYYQRNYSILQEIWRKISNITDKTNVHSCVALAMPHPPFKNERIRV